VVLEKNVQGIWRAGLSWSADRLWPADRSLTTPVLRHGVATIATLEENLRHTENWFMSFSDMLSFVASKQLKCEQRHLNQPELEANFHLGLGFSVGDDTCFRLFRQVYLALSANPASHF